MIDLKTFLDQLCLTNADKRSKFSWFMGDKVLSGNPQSTFWKPPNLHDTTAMLSYEILVAKGIYIIIKQFPKLFCISLLLDFLEWQAF